MSHEKIVTLFDTVKHAQEAKASLEKAGFASDDISLISGEQLKSEGKMIREPGIWQRLFGHEVVESDARVYTEALETGGVVLAVRADESKASKALDNIHAYQKTMGYSQMCPVYKHTDNCGCETKKEKPMRLAEEQLEVGKRQYQSGITRLHRYVVEKNVDANVTLHEEHAKVVRKAIDEPSCLKNIDWSDEVIEVFETNEKAVVGKTAHFIEEVGVGREGSDRVETVHETVRQQRADVTHVDSKDPGAPPPKDKC